MLRLFRLRILIMVLCCLSLVIVFYAQQGRLFERLWFDVLEQWHGRESHEATLWLPAYQADIQAKSIPGVSNNLSALTFDSSRHTLFSLTNNPARLLELSTKGDVLRTISLKGFSDPEAIEYIRPGVYMIAEERRQRLIEVHVDDDTRVIDAADPINSRQLSLNLADVGNKGFEGLAYDALHERIYVAKEKDPVRIFEIEGFTGQTPRLLSNIDVSADTERDGKLFVSDLSSLHFDHKTGHLLVLSDESRLVIELNRHGNPISTLSLLGGSQGLDRTVPQPEGMTMDDQGALYVVSEPNLFYRFASTSPSSARQGVDPGLRAQQ